MNFETVVGLEVHIELQTNTKLFSPAKVGFGDEPNANTNAYDFAYPGAMPVTNEAAIDYAMKAALAINCDINQYNYFVRKNYFYPDLPQAYQITQGVKPIGENGYIDIEVDGEKKRIRIERLHLEQDAGKNIHGSDASYVDLNRAGTPLLEIVSEPDIRSADEAYAYLEALRERIMFTGVSDVRMEEGTMRCDANVSVRPVGDDKLYNRTELKNLNSLNYVRKAIDYEAKRQVRVYQSGGDVEVSTRRYDENTGQTHYMRPKKDAGSYRQIPDTDIPPVVISDEWLQEATDSLPVMPAERRDQYVSEWGLAGDDAKQLTSTLEMSEFFEESVAAGADPKQAANWLIGDTTAYLNAEQIELADTELTPENLAGMLKLIEDGTISSKIAKQLFNELLTKGGDPNEVVKAKGWIQISDTDTLLPIITEVLDNNQQSIDDFKDGKDRAIGFLVGQVMKATKGQANPGVVNKLLMEEINKR